jgi:deoxyribodipyrimidine photolyase
MNNPASLVCFQQDLRLANNPALPAAIQRDAVVPVFNPYARRRVAVATWRGITLVAP